MKSTFTAFASRTLVRAAGTLRQYLAPRNCLEQSTASTATEDHVQRNGPNHVALFASSSLLNMPVWGLLRAKDVIR